MNVLLISRCPPYPLHLGDRLIIWHLARELQSRGFVVDLLAYTQFEQDYNETAQYADLFRSIQLFPEPRRTLLSYLKRALLPSARFPRQAGEAWSPQMWQAIENQLAQQQYDVIHLFGGVHVYELANLVRGYPALITPYESYSLYLRRVVARGGGLSNYLALKMAQHYERWMFTPYARTVVLAEEDRDELLRLNPALPVAVIPNGIDLETFHADEQERAPALLLFVGNYEYPPNHEAALYLAEHVLPEVQRVLPQARLQLVGNAPSAQLLALQSDTIEVTGRVADVRPYLEHATIFVCPLLTGAGMKNKVLEALAMGVPVAATPLSVDGIAVENRTHALIVDAPQIAQAVITLLQDKPLRDRLSTAGPALIADRYSWQRVAGQYAALYAALQPDSL